MHPINCITLIVVLAAFSCQTAENKTPATSRMLVGDFDTAKVISQLAIKERVSRLDLVDKDIMPPQMPIDTLELTYYFAFCDCQRWILADIHNKAKTQNDNVDELDARGQLQFNLDEHGYYIEAADSSLELDWRVGVNGTTVRFIGKEYMDKRLPKNGDFTVPNPPKGKVFRYYSYEIIRPYSVWGPEVFSEVDPETGDSLTETSVLIVK
jgi:hypothetical protein